MVCAHSKRLINSSILPLPLILHPPVYTMPQSHINIQFPNTYPSTMPTITIPPGNSTLFYDAIPFMNLYINFTIHIQTIFHYLKISQRSFMQFDSYKIKTHSIPNSRYTKGQSTSNSPISHRDAATLHYINVSIGYLSGADWESLKVHL
jgi:hypothetical protein